MGNVVVQNETRAGRIFEVKNVKRGRTLIETIPVRSGIESQKGADDQPDCCFVRNYKNFFSRMRRNDFENDRQRSGGYLKPVSPPSGANENGSDSQSEYSAGKSCSTSERVLCSHLPCEISRNPSRTMTSLL